MYVLLENVCQKASKFDDIETILGLFFALFVRQLLRIRALLQLHFCLPHKLLSNTMNSFILGMSFPSCKHTILWRTLVIRWNITAFSYSISYRVYNTRKMTHSSTTHRSGECCAYAFAVWFSGRCSFSGTKILSNIALSLIHCAPFLLRLLATSLYLTF